MPEQRDLFDLAAADAVAARTSAQAELAKNLANEILKGPAKFDPKRLKTLSPQGILVLLAAIRQHKVGEAEPLRETSADSFDERMKSSSWQHLRKPEPNRLLRGLAAGVTSGLVIVAIGLVTAAFL
ncbi:hypothetical protein AFIC_000454 [[Pseudomonas] carboxydohydrogena]|jgi:hypothetical protein|uniref:Uncharacterized protein n=1 Tax=Afipia carboxydohydrogena TaxID=290 RepID=A0ABY8BPS5_AFICR|nr:hypothetical protein [[Pseudomonas] carboxydohydrogena]WEF51997.1 hypothetical protein AFIC_000454 [[Pseudomonas] carboxydohydrogena]